MSQLDTIRAALFAVLQSVPDIGRVHDRERYAKDEKAFRTLYLHDLADGTQQLRGWWLRRASTLERSTAIGREINVHTWQVRGYLALADEAATEHTFDALVEAFRDLVRQDPTLGGVCAAGPLADDAGTDGVQVNDAGPVLFCGVLCHSALLSFKTWSYL
ncbi:hypothetical protein ACFX58_03475 [Sphingomonas sp. NCPPB 2930]